MAPRALPGLGLTAYWDLGADGWKPDMDSNLLLTSALVQCSVLSSTTVLPGSPTNGMIYIVKSDNGTNPNKIAIRDNGAWVYITPVEGWLSYVRDTDKFVKYTGAAWVDVVPPAELPSTTGHAGKVLKVNALADGVEWSVDGGGASLPDISGNADKHLAVNSAGDGLVWVTAESGGGGGSDLPSLAGNGGKHLAVKTDASGVEWVAPESGGGGGGDLPSFTGNAGKHLAVNSGETAAEWVSSAGGDGVAPFHGARIRPTSLQNYTVLGAWANVRFAAADRDIGGFWNVAAPNRFTIPAGVTKVRLSASVMADTSDTMHSQNVFAFTKNGVTTGVSGLTRGVVNTQGYTNPALSIVSDTLDVVAGDYFELVYFAAGTFAIGSDALATWFAIEAVERDLANVGLNATIGELLDADTTTDPPAVGESLVWNGTKWVPGVPTVAYPGMVGVYKPFRGAMAKFNADKTFTTKPISPVTWDATDYDTNGFFSGGSPGRFTIPTGVKKIRLHANLFFPGGTQFASGGDSLHMNFMKNGSGAFRGDGGAGAKTGYQGGTSFGISSPVIPCVAGDFFEVRFNTTATANLVFGESRSYFSIEVVEAEESLP